MIYLLVLLAVIGCMALLDWRHRLFLWARPGAATAVLAVGMAYFLAWDVWGIAEGVFLHRDSPYMTGIMLAPQLPLEEGFFLLFLSHHTMILFTGAVRILENRAEHRAEHRAGRGGGVRGPRRAADGTTTTTTAGGPA